MTHHSGHQHDTGIRQSSSQQYCGPQSGLQSHTRPGHSHTVGVPTSPNKTASPRTDHHQHTVNFRSSSQPVRSCLDLNITTTSQSGKPEKQTAKKTKTFEGSKKSQKSIKSMIVTSENENKSKEEPKKSVNIAEHKVEEIYEAVLENEDPDANELDEQTRLSQRGDHVRGQRGGIGGPGMGHHGGRGGLGWGQRGGRGGPGMGQRGGRGGPSMGQRGGRGGIGWGQRGGRGGGWGQRGGQSGGRGGHFRGHRGGRGGQAGGSQQHWKRKAENLDKRNKDKRRKLNNNNNVPFKIYNNKEVVINYYM